MSAPLPLRYFVKIVSRSFSSFSAAGFNSYVKLLIS